MRFIFKHEIKWQIASQSATHKINFHCFLRCKLLSSNKSCCVSFSMSKLIYYERQNTTLTLLSHKKVLFMFTPSLIWKLTLNPLIAKHSLILKIRILMRLLEQTRASFSFMRFSFWIDLLPSYLFIEKFQVISLK